MEGPGEQISGRTKPTGGGNGILTGPNSDQEITAPLAILLPELLRLWIKPIRKTV